MGKIEKVSVSLTEELIADIQDAVASGTYASASEVIREALRGWRERRESKDAAIADLRLLIAEADASDCVEGPIDFAAIKAEGRSRLSKTS